MELLHIKLGKFMSLYTQNIDGLELQCQTLLKENIIKVHASIGVMACKLFKTDEFNAKAHSSIKDIVGQDLEAPKN